MSEPEGAGPADEPITSWIAAARSGDREAAERLYGAVYDDLLRLARAQRARLPAGDTLSTTAVVHEAYLRLDRARRLEVADRHHFYSLAARVMRQVLIDGARRELAGRRGAGLEPQPLPPDEALVAPERPAELLALDEALDALAARDPELARVVELHFFGGLPLASVAEIVGGSERTTRRAWRRARAFLYDRIRRNA